MSPIDRLAHASRWRNRALVEKAVLAFGLLGLALALPPWPGGALVLTAALAAALVAGTPPGAWLRAFAPPMGFLATGVAVVALSGEGDAVALGVRGAAATASLLLLAVTTPAADLVNGARRCGLSPELAETALATYRLLFVLDETARAIHASQVARLGTDGLGRRLRALGLLIAALLPRALERARRLEVGLAARGFDGTLPTIAPARPATAAGLAGAGVVLAAILLTEVLGVAL
ncbi:MAG: CbiQ family ECF transporter T component [Solirubrobacterales bacterium]